jgi:hypothetical protein
MAVGEVKAGLDVARAYTSAGLEGGQAVPCRPGDLRLGLAGIRERVADARECVPERFVVSSAANASPRRAGGDGRDLPVPAGERPPRHPLGDRAANAARAEPRPDRPGGGVPAPRRLNATRSAAHDDSTATVAAYAALRPRERVQAVIQPVFADFYFAGLSTPTTRESGSNGAKFALLRTPYNQWAILGSNSPLGLRYGQIAQFCWGLALSDQLRFAQIATKIATKARGKPRR